MGFTLTTPPSTEPVTVLEVMRQIRLDTSNLQPRPTAPTVALVSPATAGNVNAGAHRYRVTFVTADGETDGGDISSSVTTIAGVADDPETLDVDETIIASQQVAITDIPIGGVGVTARKIYRTAANGSSYFLLTTIADNTTTSYIDNIADSSLGAGVPSVNSTVDPELVGLIAAARHQAERYTSAGICEQVWTLTLDQFPLSGIIELPRGPVISIDAITYLDADSNEVLVVDDDEADDPTALSDLVALDQNPLSARLSLIDTTWPTTASRRGAVSIVFTVGYGTGPSDVPADLKAAILLRVADLYRNREAQQSSPLSENKTVCALLDPHVRTALV